MSDPFSRSEPFKTEGQKSNTNAHENADTDADRSAIHHTLGNGPNQAAPGNHKHKASEITDQIIRAGYYMGNFYAAGWMEVYFNALGGDFPNACLAVSVEQAGEYGNPYGPVDFQIYHYTKEKIILSCNPAFGVLTNMAVIVIAVGN